jgi:hypothetical protein
MRCGILFLRDARACRSLLHRILQRFFEVLIGGLKIVLHGHRLRTANPAADNLHRVRFGPDAPL